MTSFKQFLEEELLDEEFATHYEEIGAGMDFALEIVRRREKLGLTQQQLADSIGMKQPMLARIENGQTPTARTLQRLAKGLKVGLLFTGDGIMVLPMAGTKSGANTVIHPVTERLWDLPEQKQILAQRQKAAECDYTLLNLKRVAFKETEKEKEKEKEADARLATAA